MSSLFCSEFVMLGDTSLGHDKQTLLEFVRISVIVGDSPPRIREHPPTNSNTASGGSNQSPHAPPTLWTGCAKLSQ